MDLKIQNFISRDRFPPINYNSRERKKANGLPVRRRMPSALRECGLNRLERTRFLRLWGDSRRLFRVI